MSSSISVTITVTKKHGKGLLTLKKALLSISQGHTIELIHTQFYCGGVGAKCTLSHLATELKEEGEGVWSSRHCGVGIARITRVE